MAQVGTNRSSDFIRSSGVEGIKMHIAYDGSNRMELVYEASADAKNGEACLLTTYQYIGITTRISGMKEELATWDSSWDF